MSGDELGGYEHEVAILTDAISILKKAREASWAKRDEPSANNNQCDKPLHQQAEEVRAHIVDRDYGLAEKKAEIMCECMRRGDWTLGG